MGYVIAGYGITFAALGSYTIWMIRRGRAITRLAPPDPAEGEA